jgi:hypothetical protein
MLWACNGCCYLNLAFLKIKYKSWNLILIYIGL